MKKREQFLRHEDLGIEPADKPEDKEKSKKVFIKPLYARPDEELAKVANLLNLKDDEGKVSTGSVSELLYILFTPHQLRLLAQALADQDAHKMTEAQEKLKVFFHRNPKKSPQFPEGKIGIDTAVQAKLNVLFGTDVSKAPRFVELFQEVVFTYLRENPEKAVAFFDKMGKIDTAYIDADNSNPELGMVGQFLGEIKTMFQNPTESISLDSLVRLLQRVTGQNEQQKNEDTHPMMMKKPLGQDYLLSYYVELASKIHKATNTMINAQPADVHKKNDAERDLRSALLQYIEDIVTGYHNV